MNIADLVRRHWIGFSGIALVVLLTSIGVASMSGWKNGHSSNGRTRVAETDSSKKNAENGHRSVEIQYRPRVAVDSSGFRGLTATVEPWPPSAKLAEISALWNRLGDRVVQSVDQQIASQRNMTAPEMYSLLHAKVLAFNSEGDPKRAYEALQQMRSLLISHPEMVPDLLYSVIYLQGVTALRRGENENCIMCRGESSCILPIGTAAQHKHPAGSRIAITHFTEYLVQFPDDLEVRWLLNVAHMTLGEYPAQVDPRFLLSLDHYDKPEFDIGRFRDIGHLVGVNRITQAGGAIMDDFDNDGLLDIVNSAMDPTEPLVLLHNTGKGTFEVRSETAGIAEQLGGLNCIQTDYNNDGYLDIFVIRGAWIAYATRPSLLRNNCNGTFTDVTEEAGLLDPVNSIAASWSDYDNDGWLDLFICCERQQNRLYRNLGNGKFEDVTKITGLHEADLVGCKGAAWIDYDNDGFPDLFQNYLNKTADARLFHNNRDGTFRNVTLEQGIHGPAGGFSCWAWDYDNDGWQDLFATCYERTVGDVVKGLMGQPHEMHSNCLYRNLGGHGFEDVTKEAGLDLVFSTMGSNFGDFDNDGFLDMYLGTGDPSFATLVPNRMFKNVGGKRFAEITSSSGTGHLQKGHGVACGDWDRDGNTDIFIEMGGAVNGDKYHNILFQNPGHENRWLTVKLTGEKSNRAAIGARIKIVTAGQQPQTFYRHISSGSSFGANPLQQTIGLANADQIATLEVYWPTSGTTQTFHDVAVDQAIAIKEFAPEYQKLDWQPITVPTASAENGKMMLKN